MPRCWHIAPGCDPAFLLLLGASHSLSTGLRVFTTMMHVNHVMIVHTVHLQASMELAEGKRPQHS